MYRFFLHAFRRFLFTIFGISMSRSDARFLAIPIADLDLSFSNVFIDMLKLYMIQKDMANLPSRICIDKTV